MFFLNATDPTTIKLAQDGDDRRRLSRAAPRATTLLKRRARAARRRRVRRRRTGTAAAQGAGDPLHQQADAGRPAEAHGARAARHRGQRRSCRSSAIRRRSTERFRRGVLFPRLRLGAAVLAGRPRDAGDALARRRADACCRRATCAAAIRRPRPGNHDKGREDHHRQPRAVPPRRQHAQLPRHQDGAARAWTSCRNTSSRSSRLPSSFTPLFEQVLVDVEQPAAGEDLVEFVFLQLVHAGAARHDHRLDVEIVQRVRDRGTARGCRVICAPLSGRRPRSADSRSTDSPAAARIARRRDTASPASPGPPAESRSSRSRGSRTPRRILGHLLRIADDRDDRRCPRCRAARARCAWAACPASAC